jgi:hypothetical protein
VYRTAYGISTSQHLERRPTVIYHTLHPHPALSPVPDQSDPETFSEQERNEQAWRHMLVQGILAVVLPTEDLQNGCLRSLVEEIIAEMIIGNVVSNRLCQPWALWELITNVIRSVQGQGPQNVRNERRKKGDDKNEESSGLYRSPKSRLAKFGLLSNSLLNGDQEPADGSSLTSSRPRSVALTTTLWTILSYLILVFTAGRALLVILLSLSKLPSRTVHLETQGSSPRPVLSMGIWSAASNMIELPTRMPWLSGIACLANFTAVSGPGRVAGPNSKIDRYVRSFSNPAPCISSSIGSVLHATIPLELPFILFRKCIPHCPASAY